MADSDRTPLVSMRPYDLHDELPFLQVMGNHNDKQQQDKSQGVLVRQVQPALLVASSSPGHSDPEKPPAGGPPPYSAFSPWRRRFILAVITVAGFFGPLAGGIYLPALPVLEREFQASATAINITVSVFMLTFAFAVST